MKHVKMILTNRFDPDVRVYKEAKYLAAKGYDVEILCWDREHDYIDRENEEIEGIRIRRFYPYSRYGTGVKQLFAYCKFILECRKYLAHQTYSYLHCHDLDGVIVGWLARKNTSSLIFDMHEFYEANSAGIQKLRYVVRAVVSFFQNRCDHIIYVNDTQVGPMSQANRCKLVFLPNYPEAVVYQGCEKTESQMLRISYIGAVRQYSELKNLLDASSGMKGVEVHIHGAGVAYESLREIAPYYPNAYVTGRYHFNESARLYSETDVLYAIYPSSSEQYMTSYPVKFFEAIITKTPIIVGKDTVMAEFVESKDIGFVVDGDSVEQIRTLIQYIDNDREVLDRKTANLSKIQFDYSWEEVVTNLDRIYSRC